MVMTDAVVGLGATQGEGGPLEGDWKEVKGVLVQMVAAIVHLSKEVVDLKAAKAKSVMFKGLPPLIKDRLKGKDKESTTKSEGEGKEGLETSVAPGDDSILGEDEGLPKPLFTTALESKTALPSLTSSSSAVPITAKAKTKPTCVVATAYPAAWSTYLTLVGAKAGSVGLKGGIKGTATPHMKVPMLEQEMCSGVVE
jgi:hypothetical protein